MKKIVGIIAALALAGSVFARPDITPVITSFKGDATLEWIANLDKETTGMANTTSVEWKVQTRSADWGGESNSGDGLWGELSLNTGGDKVWEYKGGDPAANIYNWGANGWRDLMVVGTAKVHFMDGDTYLNVDILKPDFQIGEIGYVRATKVRRDKDNNWDNLCWDNYEDVKFGKVGGYGAAYNGFTVNFGIPVVDLAFAFADNGEQKKDDKEFAFKFAATLKPIDGLSLYAGVTKCTEENNDNLGLAFTAGYNYNIDEKFYVKPAVQFDMFGDVMNISAAAIFGWGPAGQCWNHDFLGFNNLNLNLANNGTRCNNGLSVMFTKNLKNPADPTKEGIAELNIEAFDNSLLGDLGIGTITWGAAYRVKGDDLGKGAVTFGLVYDNNIDIVYIKARVSFGMDLAVEGDNNAVAYGLRVGTTQLIANTDLYADYVGSVSKYDNPKLENGVSKGTFKLGCKISF